MKSFKVMSIIGIVWFSLMLLAILGSEGDDDVLIPAGFLGLGYALAYSITGYVKSKDRTD